MSGPPVPVIPSTLRSEFLQAILETADVGQVGISVVAVDVDPPEYLFANTGIAEMLGYTVAEFVAVPIWELLSPATSPEMHEKYHRRFEGPQNNRRFEVWMRRKDGTPMPFEATTHRVHVGGRPANATFMIDISDRVDATAALAVSETRFRTAVESAPDGVVILRGPNILYCNSRAASLLGYDAPAALLGRSMLEFLHPEDAALAGARIMELFRTGERFAKPAEYRSMRPDGRENFVEISSIPIEFEGGAAVLAFARDVTERRAMHEQMVQADRLAALGTLAAGIAHEINNPLTYVLLGLQYLERELPKVAHDPTRLLEALTRLGEVRNGAERVGTIVRDLKTFARSDEVARGPVDIHAVVEAAIKIADNEIRHRAVLVRDYHDVPPVDGNAARLEQVFLNLLVNAAHAVSDREPQTSEVRVSIRAGADGTVRIEVTDNGAGIASDVLYRVFDPFFTTKPVGVGTGLGLPICKSIVESFGGQIFLESEPGKGTTARVTLPARAKDAPVAEEKSPRPPSRPPEGRGRVLIVDDEPLVAGVLLRLLASDHEVAIATSGREALVALDEGEFDAIVCDVMMPGMTGMDFYSTLRARDPALAERIVFMTGGAFVPRVAEFLSTVDNPKIEKPFDLAQLRGALRQIPKR